MTGMAVGMALSGKIALTYSIANFPTLRCLEHIRNDVCYHQANVKIVAVGGGFAYGAAGASHHATEDLAVMRLLPGMMVVAPGDPIEARLATRAIVAHPGPCYLRLGKAGEPVVHQTVPDFQLGKAVLLREGMDITLVSTGGMLLTSLRAGEKLASLGYSPRILSMHTLKPLDEEAVLSAAHETRAIISLEEHSIIGGLGSALAEVLAEAGPLKVKFRRMGLPSAFSPHIGSQEYLLAQHGLTVDSVVETAESMLRVPGHA